MEIKLSKDGDHCLLTVGGDGSIAVNDYTISCSPQGTVLELKIKLTDEIMEFATSANQE